MQIKKRLLFFFLLVILVNAFFTSVLVGRSTASTFRSFIFSGDSRKAEVYAPILSDYYTEKAGWAGVQEFLREMPVRFSRMLCTEIHGMQDMSGSGNGPDYTAEDHQVLMADRVVLADASGKIVADTAGVLIGSVHPARHLVHGIPVMQGTERIGTVLVGSMIDSSLTGVAGRFLNSVLVSILASSLVSALIALFVGFVFSSRLSRPLVLLAASARSVASRKPTAPVPVSGDDELADLSRSFNEMSAELDRLDAAKRQIIADSAHELRTPVTLIRGTVEGILDGIFPADKATLGSLHEETLRLSRLIDTLRELEIIESGDLKLEKQKTDLSEILLRAVSLFSAEAMQKDISLSFDAPVERLPYVQCDRLRIGEVVYNILSNSIRYTPSGGDVTVSAGLCDGPPEKDSVPLRVFFRVDDSGPGIPVSERTHIFERFYRIDKSRSTDTGGRGLGLAIAYEIVRAHNGTIRVDESPAGGSAFIVSLP